MISSSSLALLLFCDSLLLIAALASGKHPEFNYLDTQKWGSLDPSYAACSTGKRQSPININTNDVVVNKTMQPLTRDYHVYNASVTTDGVDAQVEFTGLGGLIIDGKSYKLKQMHWHTPSEHLFNGEQYAAELHQVHVATDGSRTVVGMLYKLGNPDPVLSMLKPQLDELAKVATCEGEEAKIVVPKFESRFLRKRPRKYYRYPGSLTTPPCDENVIWNVLSKVKTISKDQVEALKASLCEANKMKNARPTQALNGRSQNTRASTSSSRYELHGCWVKFKKRNCDPSKYYDIKVSGSKNNPGNPGRSYYKCVGCGEFDWVYEDDMMKMKMKMKMKSDCGDEVEGKSAGLAAEVNGLKAAVEALAKSGTFVVKMAVVLYLVLVICVLLK